MGASPLILAPSQTVFFITDPENVFPLPGTLPPAAAIETLVREMPILEGFRSCQLSSFVGSSVCSRSSRLPQKGLCVATALFYWPLREMHAMVHAISTKAGCGNGSGDRNKIEQPKKSTALFGMQACFRRN